MVELVLMGVDSFQTATSKSGTPLLVVYEGFTVMLETPTWVPPEAQVYNPRKEWSAIMVARYFATKRISWTYERSSADLDLRGSEVDGAVASSDDGVGVDQNTTAEVRALRRQTDDVGELAGSSGGSSNDISTTGLDGSSQSESGQHKS